MNLKPYLKTILFLLSMLFLASDAMAECCYTNCGGHCSGRQCHTPKCSDCTNGTPYCGEGKCNIFGCNCDGGCRGSEDGDCKEGCKNKCNRCGLPPQGIQLVIDPQTKFDAIDISQDGQLSLAEVETWFENSPQSGLNVADGFQDMDQNGDGQVSPREFDSDLAP